LLVATALLLLGELAPAIFPVWVAIDVIGPDVRVSMDGSMHSFHVPAGRQFATVAFAEPGPLEREYQVDGSERVVRLDRDASVTRATQDLPFYRVEAWMRDEASYSHWEHLRLIDLDNGRVVAEGRQAVQAAKLPPNFRLEAGLRRPEAPAQIWLSTDAPLLNDVLELSRTGTYARWMVGSDGNDEVARWFFPEQVAPFAAGLLQLVGRAAMAAYALVAAMFGLGWLLQQLPIGAGRRALSGTIVRWIVVVTCGMWLAAACWVTIALYDQLPHLLDASTYYFESNLIRTGRLWLEPPPLAQVFRTDLQTVYEGRWIGVYPPGAPFMLAAGAIVGLSWFIGPLSSLVGLVCTALAARQVFGGRLGLVTLALGLISPFVLFLAGSFMSEPIAGTWLAGALLTFTYAARQRRDRWYVAIGALFGCSFLTREYSTLLFALPIVGWMILHKRWRGLVLLAAAGAPFLVAYLAYNVAVTGDPLLLPRNAVDPTDRFGFGTFGTRHHTPAAGLVYTDINLTLLQFDLFGWPPLFALGLPMLPFLLGSANRYDLLLAGGVVCCIAGYILVPGHGAQLGPRYYYGALPYLLPLVARGLQSAAATLRKLGLSPHVAAQAALAVAGLLTLNTLIYYVPHAVERRANYLGMVGRPGLALPFVETTATGPLLKGFAGPTLVIVPDSELFKTLSALNCPLLDRQHIQGCQVLFVGAGRDRVPALSQAYPGRTVLVAVPADQAVILVPYPG
jgi:hypothetical protein